MLAYVKQFGVCIPPEFKDTFQLVSLFELQKLHKPVSFLLQTKHDKLHCIYQSSGPSCLEAD